MLKMSHRQFRFERTDDVVNGSCVMAEGVQDGKSGRETRADSEAFE